MEKNKKKYVVQCKKTYLDDGCSYKTEITLHETWAVSPEKAQNNVKWRVIGKKYALVDEQPNNDRFCALYEFTAFEEAFKKI